MPSFLLVVSLDNGDDVVHAITFRDDDEKWHWDVASCGEGMGDYGLVNFADGSIDLSRVCGRCLEAVGSDVLAKRF